VKVDLEYLNSQLNFSEEEEEEEKENDDVKS